MVKVLLLCFSMASFAFADIVTNFAATSNYVWRGQSQSNNDSAIQGAVEFKHNNFSVGTWLSSIGGQNSATELDLYTFYTHSFSSNLILSMGMTQYAYVGNHGVDTLEFFLKLLTPVVGLFVGATDQYFGKESSSVYYNLSKSFYSLGINMGVNLSLGYTKFASEVNVGSKNILDYKLGLLRSTDGFDFELFFSDTDRKNFDGTAREDVDDVAVGVSVTKSI
jgi:uncharacterized protein (TIGR02001 family)